jgi:hypothetical protein
MAKVVDHPHLGLGVTTTMELVMFGLESFDYMYTFHV